MVEQEGKRADARKKPRKLRYFFLDGQLTDDGPTIPLLYRSLHINRGLDKITTWCYPLEKRVVFTYSDVQRHKAPAYTTAETSKMLNRSRLSLELAIINGNIEEPQYTYGLNSAKNRYKYMWAERNILEAHAYFSTVHYGHPRKDGMVTPLKLPTVRELKAMIRQEELLYVRTTTGEFIPVWKAPDFD